MAQPRKILIADPDVESIRPLSKALRQKGYQVHYAPDGSKALEIAVLRHPDLTLFDEGCRLLAPRTFMQILRTNPRTEDIPVVLTTAGADAEKVRALRDGYLRKPFNLDEVLARIDHIFRRAEAARDLRGEAKEIEGTLTQLSIADLLQILAMNRRSGRLNLTRGGERGEIHLGEGRPLNAKAGAVEGEKALFRLLGWTEGSFAFTPGSPTPRVRIQRTMDDALLEGMRQNDEVGRLLSSLPPRTARLQLVPEAAGPMHEQQHPVTAEVMELLKRPRALGELLDLAQASDLDVLAALATLLQKGMARVLAEEESDAGGREPLLGPADMHALRARLLRGRVAAKLVIGKVFLCGTGPSALRKLSGELPDMQRLPVEPIMRGGFGTLGRLEISESLRVDLYVLPPGDAARPLWRPFSAGAVGALLLDDSEQTMKLARFLGWEVRIPLAMLGGEIPQALSGAPAGVASGEQPLEVLRLLLARAVSPTQPWYV